MIPHSSILFLLLNIGFSVFIGGESSTANDVAPYGNYDDLRRGYFYYYQCIEKCYEDIFFLDYIDGNLCDATVELDTEDWSDVPFEYIVESIECITVKCRNRIPPSVCDQSRSNGKQDGDDNIITTGSTTTTDGTIITDFKETDSTTDSTTTSTTTDSTATSTTTDSTATSTTTDSTATSTTTDSTATSTTTDGTATSTTTDSTTSTTTDCATTSTTTDNTATSTTTDSTATSTTTDSTATSTTTDSIPDRTATESMAATDITDPGSTITESTGYDSTTGIYDDDYYYYYYYYYDDESESHAKSFSKSDSIESDSNGRSDTSAGATSYSKSGSIRKDSNERSDTFAGTGGNTKSGSIRKDSNERSDTFAGTGGNTKSGSSGTSGGSGAARSDGGYNYADNSRTPQNAYIQNQAYSQAISQSSATNQGTSLSGQKESNSGTPEYAYGRNQVGQYNNLPNSFYNPSPPGYFYYYRNPPNIGSHPSYQNPNSFGYPVNRWNNQQAINSGQYPNYAPPFAYGQHAFNNQGAGIYRPAQVGRQTSQWNRGPGNVPSAQWNQGSPPAWPKNGQPSAGSRQPNSGQTFENDNIKIKFKN